MTILSVSIQNLLLTITTILIWGSCEEERKDESSCISGVGEKSIWYDDDGSEEGDSEEIESGFDISAER